MAEEDIKPNLAELCGTASSPTPTDPPLSDYPPDQPTDLCSDEYPGPLNFEVYLVMPNDSNERKTPWEYSIKVERINILANTKFPVAFGVRTRPPDANLFVRATPVFSQIQYFPEVVQRCVAHQHPQDASNKDVAPHVLRHIIRCCNTDTVYCGGNEDRHPRLNLVIPLSTPQAGTAEVVTEFFSFVCSNSCLSGMNRRPIKVIFTLENQRGVVLGRRVLRVCTHPKRDRKKEEGVVEEQAPPAKKKNNESQSQ